MEQLLERRRLSRVAWLIALAGALRLLPLARLHPLAWDEIEYFRATDWVRRGLVPYRDFWEHHTPLQWFVFAPVAALTKSPGVSAILLMRWAQVPLWIVAFVLLAKWMRRAGISAPATAVAMLLALCSTLFTLGAIEYRVDVLGCVLYIIGLYLGGFAGGAALCLAGFANIRLGPLLILTILAAPRPPLRGTFSRSRGRKEIRDPSPATRGRVALSEAKGRVRAVAGAITAFLACATYFLATHSAAIAFRRVWTDNYLADRLSGEPPLAMLRRLAAPFGFVSKGFDIAAVDAGTIVIFIAGAIGLIHALVERGALFTPAILQIANIAFIASMKFVYHYHFMIIILLALPFVARACDLLLARGRWREVMAVALVATAVSVFASVFRGKEADLDYQDFVMRAADRLTPPGARVFDGVGYAIRREPAYRYWFLAQIVRTLEAHKIFERYDMAARPPDAVIIDIPTTSWLAAHRDQAELVRRYYRPVLRELWLPVSLTPQMSASTIPGPPPGVSLDAVNPPVTHVPRLW